MDRYVAHRILGGHGRRGLSSSGYSACILLIRALLKVIASGMVLFVVFRCGSALADDPQLATHLKKSLVSGDANSSQDSNVLTKSGSEANHSSGGAISSDSASRSEFHYHPDSSRNTEVVREAIRQSIEAKNARDLEEAAHPFWNAPLWTNSPLKYLALILGGDHHALQTPLTEREKLAGYDYNFKGSIDKAEKTIGFEQIGPKAEVLVGPLRRNR